jgi:diguanylate cyclase (GGDEF)-like protein/PAS domain S-box-containing protein
VERRRETGDIHYVALRARSSNVRARARPSFTTGRASGSAVGRAHAAAAISAAIDALITVDQHGRVLEFNPAAEEIFGYARADAIGRELADLIVPPAQREAYRRGLARWTAEGPTGVAGESLDTPVEMAALNARGEEFPVEIAICRLAVDGPPLFTAWIRDIREHKLGEERLRAAEQRYRTLVEQLPLVIYVDAIDAVSSNLYTSPQVEPLLGYAPKEWQDDAGLFVRLLHPDDRERVLAAHQAAHDGEPLSVEYRILARDGRVVWVHDEARAIVGPDGVPVALQGYLLDITAEREAAEQLRYQAFHDPLTGLPNRTLFKDHVLGALAAGNEGAEAAMLLLDIDDFKAINDRFGHLEADVLLRDIGARLREALPGPVVIGRLGGDEFAALVDPADDPAGIAVRSAGALIDALRKPFPIAGVEVFVTTSVGIALGKDVDQLFRRADVAMYRAKSAGKAQYALYAPWMDDAVLGRLELLGELRQARPDEDFLLHYQPVLDLATRELLGVEALLRWRHPTRGIVQPVDFIPIAEESGLIVPVGRWVLEQACRQVAVWRDAPDGHELTVSVNVSARQLQHPEFVHDVRVALDAAALDPRRLVLEITEGAVVGDHAVVSEMLEALQLMGVGLALDDFGIGYSSLSMLETLPFDTLKLDRAFVSRLGATRSSAPLVRAIADLGAALELEVVAEGIETELQVAELRRLGVRRGQGSFFSPPLEPRRIEELVGRGRRTRPTAA